LTTSVTLKVIGESAQAAVFLWQTGTPMAVSVARPGLSAV
jgi:hypothetical protein